MIKFESFVILLTRDVASQAMKMGISCYNYSYSNAYQVAKFASNGATPVHDEAHKKGYYNHYHRANRKGVAHAFYGAPNYSV